ANSRGSDILAYHLQYSDDGGSSWETVSSSISPSATSFFIADLLSGYYEVRLRAENARGTGGWSSIATGTIPGDFNTLSAAGNTRAGGLWSDGTTMWVSNGYFGSNEKIYAYNMSDTSRDSSKDFNTLSAAGNGHPYGIWSDGTTMWVSDYQDNKIYAYKMSDRSRDSAKDFTTLSAAGNTTPYGLWSDGTTMWVSNGYFGSNEKIYAYKMSDRSRDSPKDFNTLSAAGNTSPNGLWSDGTTMWVLDYDDDEKIYTYDLATKAYAHRE
ncbi:MAG: hypothetical protein ACR2PY_02040, partial [Salinispira sp.]